jgi:hypothetical protein
MKKKAITTADLQYFFPKDTIWRFVGADIQGFSMANSLFFYIGDGQCYSSSGKWIVWTYKLKKPPVTIQEFIGGEIVLEHFECIKEELKNFKKY